MPRVLGVVVFTLAALATAGANRPGTDSRRVTSRPAPLTSDWVRANLMRAHYRSALAIQDSVLRGDVTAVNAGAAALAAEAPPSGLPASASTYVEAMRQAARRAAAATSLGQAASETAGLLATCGECHLAIGTRPAVIAPPSPIVGGGVGHMLLHQQAVELMLEGLVVPSATSWQDGARGLEGAPLRRRELPSDPALTRELLAAETRIHNLAGDAKGARDAKERTEIYGELLANCASCHAQHRAVWGPPPR